MLRNAVAKLVALLLFAGPLLALAHLASEPHFFNAVTGNWEHKERPVVFGRPGSPAISEDSTEVCQIVPLFLNQNQLWPIAFAVVVLRVVLRALAPQVKPSAALDHRSILAVAPKHSPPFRRDVFNDRQSTFGTIDAKSAPIIAPRITRQRRFHEGQGESKAIRAS